MIKLRSSSLRAMTVVELIVALGIFTFGAAGAYVEYLDTSRHGATLVERAQARLLAHEQLAQLLASPYDKLAAWTPPTAPMMLDNNFYTQAQVTHQPDRSLTVAVAVWRPLPGMTGPPPGSAEASGVKLP